MAAAGEEGAQPAEGGAAVADDGVARAAEVARGDGIREVAEPGADGGALRKGKDGKRLREQRLESGAIGLGFAVDDGIGGIDGVWVGDDLAAVGQIGGGGAGSGIVEVEMGVVRTADTGAEMAANGADSAPAVNGESRRDLAKLADKVVRRGEAGGEGFLLRLIHGGELLPGFEPDLVDDGMRIVQAFGEDHAANAGEGSATVGDEGVVDRIAGERPVERPDGGA